MNADALEIVEEVNLHKLQQSPGQRMSNGASPANTNSKIIANSIIKKGTQHALIFPNNAIIGNLNKQM